MVKLLVFSAYRLFLRGKKRRIEKSRYLGSAAASTPTFFAERRALMRLRQFCNWLARDRITLAWVSAKLPTSPPTRPDQPQETCYRALRSLSGF